MVLTAVVARVRRVCVCVCVCAWARACVRLGAAPLGVSLAHCVFLWYIICVKIDQCTAKETNTRMIELLCRVPGGSRVSLSEYFVCASSCVLSCRRYVSVSLSSDWITLSCTWGQQALLCVLPTVCCCGAIYASKKTYVQQKRPIQEWWNWSFVYLRAAGALERLAHAAVCLCEETGGGEDRENAWVGKSEFALHEEGASSCCMCPMSGSVVSHMNESCRIWMIHVTHEWVMPHRNTSCHLYWWVVSHILMSHVTYIDESCHKAHMDPSCHVTYIDESCHMNESCNTWRSNTSYK